MEAYQITDLGVIGGAANSQGTAINTSGEVTGRLFWLDPQNQDHVHAFLWQSGHVTDLGTLPGLPDSTSGGLNNRGQVVGIRAEKVRTQTPERQPNHSSLLRAFVSTGRAMTRLPTMPGYPNGIALAVNNRGQIVGSVRFGQR